jgi:hypothetical protein
MVDDVIAGVKSFVKYGWETTFGSAAGTIDKAFGHGVKIDTLSRKNTMERIFQIGARNAQKLVVKKYEPTTTISFVLSNPWFFRAVIGATPSVLGTGPYNWTWAESDTVSSITILNQINTAGPDVMKLLGGKVNSCVITCAVNELVKVKLDIPFVNETLSAVSVSPVSETEEPFVFSEGTLELPTGVPIAYIQTAEVTITNNIEVIWQLGTRFGQASVPKQREYTLSGFSAAFVNSATVLQKFYGSASAPAADVAETATLKLNFTNGLTSTNERTITLTFTGVKFDDDSLPQDPTAIIWEDATGWMRSLSVTATNNTGVAP